MEFWIGEGQEAGEIAAFFERVFAASESAEEGRLVGGLARDLMILTPAEDVVVLTAREGGALVGCIILSRLDFAQDGRVVFLVAPVAVATERQGQGIGQALLRHGLEVMRARGVDVAMTYGDPAWYGRVGFRQVTAEEAAPPQPLQQPEGWLAQSLTEEALRPLRGASRCVAALDRAVYW
jgi:predicted N-acetyltransferase YhbS